LIVEVATRLFIERGFDATSIDAVAEAAGVSKPTVYARYRDKRELFEAVLRGRIAGWLAPLSKAAESFAARGHASSLEQALDEISRILLTHTQTPGAAMLSRCIIGQATRFPDIAKLAYEEGWLRGVQAVATLLEQFAQRRDLAIDDPEMAADLFLNMVLGKSSRLALYGIDVPPETLERRRRAAVALFLNGVRTR
jgi:AcrR family transcriptional regulator